MSAPDIADLQALVDAWGLETPAERLCKRADSTMEEIQAFYAAMIPRLKEFIDFLNQFPSGGLPPEYRRLSYAVLATLEVDDPVNLWRRPNLTRASDMRTWATKKNFYDQPS